MAKKSKGNRITIALRCTETGMVTHHTQVNKMTNPKLQIKKYNKKLRKHTLHVAREKLK
jgi:ribosomal protein L33